MIRFNPDVVIFEPQALEYPLGKQLHQYCEEQKIPIRMTTSHNRVTGIPGDTEAAQYRNAKRTLVVGVRKTLKFDTSKPSAEYAIPLTTGCAGHCHYCYLQTTMSSKPYIRVYVNLDDILAEASNYIEERKPEITRFEAACTGDPVSLEHLTGALRYYIEYMGKQEYGRLRFVTKFANIDSLLDADHRGHTRIRFSINSSYVIRNFEPSTSSFEERIEAAGKVAEAGYPLGFIIAPIIIYEGWKKDYLELIDRLHDRIGHLHIPGMEFELIQHRFTNVAKKTILKRYPKTKLDMDEEKRQVKWGRYGRFKHVYKKEEAAELDITLREAIMARFPEAEVAYFV